MAKKQTENVERALAQNVLHFRTKLGLTQERLSRKCGLHYSYVNRLERQQGNPRLSTLKKLAKALDTTVVKLMTPRTVA